MTNEESFKLFKKYGFDTVDIVTIGVYSDYDKLCDDLVGEYFGISSSTIASEEEGAVWYFIKRDKENPLKDEVVSLSKVKTLEYRIFRKLREKMRNFVTFKT